MRLFSLFSVLLLFPLCALPAEVVIGDITVSSSDESNFSMPIKLLLLFTVLSLAPSLLVVTTSFTRIIIVLSILRQALGMQNTPPNIVLITLSLFMTIFVMQPVFSDIYKNAYIPYEKQEITGEEMIDNSISPLKQYMEDRTRDRDIEVIREMSGKDGSSIEMLELIPAYLMSEIFVAFKIGFIIFLPFLLVDIVVASILMSMGMIMVPPMMISLPIKIMLFVLVDGWSVIALTLFNSLSVT